MTAAAARTDVSTGIAAAEGAAAAACICGAACTGPARHIYGSILLQSAYNYSTQAHSQFWDKHIL